LEKRARGVVAGNRTPAYPIGPTRTYHAATPAYLRRVRVPDTISNFKITGLYYEISTALAAASSFARHFSASAAIYIYAYSKKSVNKSVPHHYQKAFARMGLTTKSHVVLMVIIMVIVDTSFVAIVCPAM